MSPTQKSSIRVTINGRQFYAEGNADEVAQKLDEFMGEIFSPLRNAINAALGQKTEWRKVLGIRSKTVTIQQVERRFKALAKRHHPDHGGSSEKFQELMKAREAAKLELSA